VIDCPGGNRLFSLFRVEMSDGRIWARTSDPQLVEHAVRLDPRRLAVINRVAIGTRLNASGPRVDRFD
jgi:hypothetical protein